VTLEKLGYLAKARGDLAGALRYYSEGKSIAERLAASDPANAGSQRDLSVTLEKLGDLAEAQGDLAGALRYYSEGKSIAERFAASDPANAGRQRDLVVSLQRSAFMAARVAEADEAAKFLAQCHSTLMRMRARKMHMDSGIADFLAQLEASASENYARLVAMLANSSTTAPSHPAPPITIPDPQPRREISTEELRESARFSFGKGRWEGAAMEFQKLLDRGEPIEELAPQIVTCLLNAHETLLPHDAATIEDLLQRLESAGHTPLAADLRRQLEAKQPKPKKPWWKLR
jgi:tetratricopeptide (TPR) repeat protein